jgi:uncharacterized iron-regulated membrane protein
MSLLRKAHAWCGLILCILLAPIVLSGSVLVFKPQWIRATVPEARVLAEPTAPEAAATMRTAMGLGEVRRVMFANEELGVHHVTFANGRSAYLSSREHTVVSEWAKNDRVIDFLFDLHHHYLSGEVGAKVVGVVGLATLAMVITGLILWLPAARSFRARALPNRSGKAGWLAAHRDLGVLSAPLVVVLVLTGTSLALGDWERALAAAQARFPAAQLRIATLPDKPKAPMTIRLRQPPEWHANGRTIVYIDPATSEVLAAEDPLKSPLRAQVYAAAWPIHASKVGGLGWQILSLITGVSLFALSLYGAEAYRRSIFRRSPSQQSRPGSEV